MLGFSIMHLFIGTVKLFFFVYGPILIIDIFSEDVI